MKHPDWCLYPTIHQTKGWNWRRSKNCGRWPRSLYPTIHQTKGWNEKKRTWLLRPTSSLSYNPSNQGLKLQYQFHFRHPRFVFILQSIKPRVETYHLIPCRSMVPRLYPTIHQTKGWNIIADIYSLIQLRSLSYNPSNQGLKLVNIMPILPPEIVFILQSIKPRVETANLMDLAEYLRSLYPTIHQTKGWNLLVSALSDGIRLSLSYNPSNQGLKLSTPRPVSLWKVYVFILQSIKPRVETQETEDEMLGVIVSLSYNPSNQGLKLDVGSRKSQGKYLVFILQSIKPRVETWNMAH